MCKARKSKDRAPTVENLGMTPSRAIRSLATRNGEAIYLEVTRKDWAKDNHPGSLVEGVEVEHGRT